MASLARRVVGAIHGLASRSRFLVWVALKVRNQAASVVARSFSDGFDPARNGEARLAAAVGKSASLLVDVGANVGKYTAMFLACAPASARAILFEPSRSAAAALRVRYGADPRVEIVEAACGAVRGTVMFHEEPAGGVTSSLVRGFSAVGAVARAVPVVTLDDEMERRGVGRIDLLKIDAEGTDAFVIEGARRLLARRAIGVLQFEYNAPWLSAGRTLAGAIRFLEDVGYRTFLLRRGGLVSFDVTRVGEFASYANFVALANGAPDPIGAESPPPWTSIANGADGSR